MQSEVGVRSNNVTIAGSAIEETSSMSVFAHLYITEAGRPVRTIAVHDTTTIGRDTDNYIVMETATVSRWHAVLLRDAADALLVDLDSTNGTLVNGTPAQPDEPVRLADGDIMQLGEVVARYVARPCMSISITYRDTGGVHTAILHPASALDRTNYHELIRQACVARQSGAHQVIVDLSDIEQVSIAGLVGLHVVAGLAHAAQPPSPEAGWAAIRALAEDARPIRRLPVINPRPRIQQKLAHAPFNQFLAIYTNLDAALAAAPA
jgi:pSer/pThr/pTyr-binding forkhead associated (FHA) protein